MLFALRLAAKHSNVGISLLITAQNDDPMNDKTNEILEEEKSH